VSKHSVRHVRSAHRGVPAHRVERQPAARTSIYLLLVVAVIATLALALGYSDVSASAAPLTTIYPPATTPITPAEDDAHAVELGVRFTVSVPGAVTGVRYYKSSRNRGTHVGSLWTDTGVRLSDATFTDETRSGWQTVEFAKSVALKPGTYVASYHTSAGYYAQQQWAFAAGATIGNRAIRAIGGLYSYGKGGFPRQSWHDAAYYVDVLFRPSGSAAPVSPSSTSEMSKPITSTSRRPTTTSVTTTSASRPSSSPASTSPPPTTGAAATSHTATTSPPARSATSSANSSPPATSSNSPPPAGVPAGTNLTPYTGPTTITESGTVIDGKDISHTIRIEASNVVIKNSRIHASPSDYWDIYVSGSLNVSNSTLEGADNGMAGDNYTATRVEVTKLGSDGFKLGNNVHIDQAWCHDMSPVPGAHADCVQMQNGVVNSSVTNSWLVDGDNAAIFLAPDLGPSSNGPVTIDNNVLDYGSYSLYCVDGNNGEYYVKNITITNNRFMHHARYGPADVNVPVTASNNLWFDTGTSIGGPLK
jgi:Domain of unknown function (DUF4082)